MTRSHAETLHRHRGVACSPKMAFIALLLAPFALARCAATKPAVPDNGAFFTVLSEQAPQTDAQVPSSSLEPTRATIERWGVVGADTAFEVRMSVTGNEDNERWSRSEPSATRVMGRSKTDEVTLIEQTDSSDGSTTRFLQPLVLAPTVLRAGEECASTSVVVTVRGNATDNEGGRAQRSMKLASEDQIRTPLGELSALRIDSVFTMKVPFASMRRETSTWIRAGDGPVAIRSVEKILVMGVVPRNRSETRVRLPATGLTQ